eukprot:870960-Pleurochrysis_carterae.AAC.1
MFEPWLTSRGSQPQITYGMRHAAFVYSTHTACTRYRTVCILQNAMATEARTRRFGTHPGRAPANALAALNLLGSAPLVTGANAENWSTSRSRASIESAGFSPAAGDNQRQWKREGETERGGCRRDGQKSHLVMRRYKD